MDESGLESESAPGPGIIRADTDDESPIISHSTCPFYSPCSKSQILSSSVHDDITATSYGQATWRVVIYHVFGVLSAGILYLLTYWRPDWEVRFCCNKVELSKATHLLLDCGDDPVSVCKIKREKVSNHFPRKYRVGAGAAHLNSSSPSDNDSIYHSEDSNVDDECQLLQNERRLQETGFFYHHFSHQNVKYVWCPGEGQFVELSALDRNTTVAQITSEYHGDAKDLRLARYELYGPNEIKVEVRSYLLLLFTEVLNPFYIFQVASIALWSWDEYYLYAGCIFFISCISVGVSLRETRQQSERLHAMVKTNQDATIDVLLQDDSGKTEPVTLEVTDLVPGDVLLLPLDGCLVPCDCVLLTGTAIVNESILTGESVPVAKVPLAVGSDEKELYDPEKHKRNTLFCGTSVVQTRYYNNTPVRAVVVRTGFSTTKGQLVRSIMFPKPVLFQFYQDSMKFIGVLFCIALAGMAYTCYLYFIRGLGWTAMAVRSLDLVTIVVPPALPAAMTVGTYYAQQRLHRSNIFCISPPRINVAGKLKLVVFDKTGTLTEDSLEIHGVVGADSTKPNALKATELEAEIDPETGDNTKKCFLWPNVRPVLSLSHDSRFMMALATCHDLTYVFGKLIGDPMDIKMFKATNWVLDEPAEGGYNSLVLTVVRPPDNARDNISVPLPFLQEPTASEILIPRESSSNPEAPTNKLLKPAHRSDKSLFPSTESALTANGNDESPGDVQIPDTTQIKTPSLLAHGQNRTTEKDDSCAPEGDVSVLRGADESPGSSSANNTEFLVAPAKSLYESHVLQDSASDQSSLSSDDDMPSCAVPSGPMSEQCMSLPDGDDFCGTKLGPSLEVLVEVTEAGLETAVAERVLTAPALTVSAAPLHEPKSPKTKPAVKKPPPVYQETVFQMPLEVGVVRVLAFSSEVQRMSVVVRRLGAPAMELFAKGAPEVIARLANPSTLPENLASVLESYTVRGYRVIAVAHRALPQRLTWKAAQKAPREKLERDLTFLGLLVLQNPLKPATTAAVTELVNADIRPVMATGDNVLTGVSVARECGMLPSHDPVLLLSVTPPCGGDQPRPALLTATLQQQNNPDNHAVTITPGEDSEELLQRYHIAISGSNWKLLCQHFPQYVDAVCVRGAVFGRMSPDQKTQLVETLMGLDYVVCMCGDGANDCGALKAAHVGISLSEAEASVAAPFTSNVADVSCVPRLIKEGRAALVTSFGVFKFMALYSIIQFVTVLMLYTFHTNLSDPQFLYIDLGIVTSMALFMGYSAASHSLVRERPSSSLLSPLNLFTVLLQVLAVIGGQVAPYYYLASQPWFVANTNEAGGDAGGAGDVSWEATVLFLMSGVQYIALAIVYAPAMPYARPIYYNGWLMLSLVVFGALSLVMLLYPGPWCSVLLMASEMTSSEPRVFWIFRCTLIMLAVMHMLIAWIIDDTVGSSTLLKRLFQRLRGKEQAKHRYKRVLAALQHDLRFPPLQRPIASSDI